MQLRSRESNPRHAPKSFGHHTKALSFWTYRCSWLPNHQEPEKSIGIGRDSNPGRVTSSPTLYPLCYCAPLRISKFWSQYVWSQWKKWLHLNEIRYLRGFEIADYDLWLRIWQFKKINPKWRTEIQKEVYYEWNFIPIGFWGCWLRFEADNSEMRNSRSNMAIQKKKKPWF